MATRIYFPSSGAAPISPAITTGWEDTSLNSYLQAVRTRGATAMTTVSLNDADETNRDCLFRTYVLADVLAAQTIAAQTVQFVMRCSETDVGNNMFLTWRVFVVAPDATTVRGYCIGSSTVPRRDTSEATTALTSRVDSLTSTAVTASAGDYLVIQIGMAGTPNVSLAHDSSIRIGDTASTALDASDLDTGDDHPWLEFTDTLAFGVVKHLALTGVG